MAEENKSLSPRETALRMIQHAQDDVSYEDIIRQLRILQQIEWVMRDVEMAGMPADAPEQETENEVEQQAPLRFTADQPSIVLRSRPLYSWRSLAERSEDRADPLLGKASWIY